jgi:3-oxoacyl-[acyl-carrier protein] reductase
MDSDHKGTNVFIAGSTGGIGLATAKAFLREGASVFLHGRSEEKLKDILANLEQEYPGKVFGLAADLTIEDQRQALADKIGDAFSSLDVLVSCVGNGNVKKGIELDQSDWDEIMNQNFFGNVHLVTLLLPLLKKSAGASVCLVGSIAGLQHTKAPPAYSVAKSALNTYSKCLSMELASGNIRVNIVHPGNVYFPGGRWEELKNTAPDEVDKYIQSSVAQKRFGKPEEIADAILFLSSAKSSFITGSSLVVDGGQTKEF